MKYFPLSKVDNTMPLWIVCAGKARAICMDFFGETSCVTGQGGNPVKRVTQDVLIKK